ncbi:MAG: phytanoyl-CoA dioxygenase family protein [Chitinophagales bacterium]
MKYKINSKVFDLNINQETINDSSIDFSHTDLYSKEVPWFEKGYTPLEISVEFIENIRNAATDFISSRVKEITSKPLTNLEDYHKLISTNETHLEIIKKIGKLLDTELLGINTAYLTQEVKRVCKIDAGISCKNVCDIRIFRPYRGDMMDNNPLHRDTWLKPLNNCLNVYIPLAGSNELSSLSLIPGSHLWKGREVERTKTNAYYNNIQYGLPSVSNISRDYEIVRPELKQNEILIFSSNIIHGGAVNLNEDLTRVSIEIRFWEN